VARSKTRKKNKKTKKKTPESLAERAGRWPVLGAWVNVGWRELMMARVAMVRESPRGDLAACELLVDLGCLGLKRSEVHTIDAADATWWEDDPETEAIPPGAAAAIVSRGKAWGERWGFPGGRAWRDAKPFLARIEADPEFDVPLGRDGKPVFAPGPDDHARRIISTLKRTAGPGNFTWLLGPGLPLEDAKELLLEDETYRRRMGDVVGRVVAAARDGETPDADALYEEVVAVTKANIAAHDPTKQ